MKYYTIEPVADAELGERASLDFTVIPRKIISAHIYLFNYPESELIQAYPMFLVTQQLRTVMENGGITGASFSSCQTEKSPQYDEFSPNMDPPQLFCMEPIGREGKDDLVFYTETELLASRRFVDILQSLPHSGCSIAER